MFEAWREYAVETQARRFRKDLPLEQRGQSLPPLKAMYRSKVYC